MESAKLIEVVDTSIKMAENNESQLNKEILSLQGMSSNKVRHFLNNVVKLRGNGCKYLEVGSWMGSTFVSAMYRNFDAYGISVENFSEAFQDADIKSVRTNFFQNTNEFLTGNWELKEINFLDIGKLESKIDIYFYDGAHDQLSQYNAFKIMNDNLNDTFIAIVDDWNHKPVALGTYKIFEELKYNVLKYWILPARFNGDRKQWWNGFYIAVIKKL